MVSSILSGERRWASARRGGMIVLGKVAVPKPINLPSQRLENHGVDPNVEIVSKGPHSWGPRSSSSASNAWGSFPLSPNNDGSTGSPSYHSGRPSSGSGTRPSTAGSDRSHEPIANAWGSNSRPSSASGSLTLNQVSLASLRPQSAETRPGSSQLSRFAESSDNSVAWGATGMAEKLGVTSSKNDGFSLTSGDFPTLGSEKETSSHGSHGCPDSSSGGVAYVKERTGSDESDVTGNSNVKIRNPSSWRREIPVSGEDGARSTVENWHADPQPYLNSSLPPHQYDTRHGPPVTSHPGSVWYRCPPGGPPFGSSVGPRGFPMEPFPYYQPQIPPTALTNPQQVPPPLAGPRGPHPRSGNMQRPQMPDPHTRPILQIRPGFYPEPMPYDSYYCPPMGYCNSDERDVPFMGMALGPAAYNKHSGQNAPDPNYSHCRSSESCLSGKGMISRQVESGHPQDSQGPSDGLLKQHDVLEEKDGQKWNDAVLAAAPYPGKVYHPRKSSLEGDWRADQKNDGELDTRRTMLGEDYLESVDNRLHGGIVKVKTSESMGRLKASNDSSIKNLDQIERAASVFLEVSPAPRNPNLIQKIEGLNAKARALEGRQDVQFASTREEQMNKLQVNDIKTNYSTNEVDTGSLCLESTSTTLEKHIFAVDKVVLEPVVTGRTTSARQSTYGMLHRPGHRGGGRSSIQETDTWQKKSQVPASPVVVLPTVHVESSVVHGLDRMPVEAAKKCGSYSHGNDGESEPLTPDQSDSQSQHAKTRDLELAKQRLKKEEEERARDQKAKAHAKLEELNRHMQGEALSQKLQSVPESTIQNKQEAFSNLPQFTVIPEKSTDAISALVSDANSVWSSECSSSRSETFTSLSSRILQEMPKTTYEGSIIMRNQSESVQQNLNNSESTHCDNNQHFHDSGTSKLKRMVYRQKQNSPLEKNSTEMLTSSTIESSKSDANVAANPIVSLEGVAHLASNSESSLPLNPSVVSESSLYLRRKNKTEKNKYKVEETSYAAAFPVAKDTTASDTSRESDKVKIFESVLDPSSFQSLPNSEDTSQSSNQLSLVPNEETHARVHDLCKSQHTRRTLKNPHVDISEKFQGRDAVMWAPVRSQNKTDISDEASQKTVEAISQSIKNDQQMQNNPRNKRADTEGNILKPEAKEMSQQGSSQQSFSVSVNQVTLDETARKSKSGYVGIEISQAFGLFFGQIGFGIESKTGDVSQNMSGKVCSAWCQQGGEEEATGTSNPNRNAQKPIEHDQAQKSGGSSMKQQSRPSDGWTIPENSDAPVPIPVVKDQGVTPRRKWQPCKGHKGTGYNRGPDEKRVNSRDAESRQLHLPATSKENHPVVEQPSSHWQPKSNSFSANNERVSRSNNCQNVGVEVGRVNKKDSMPQDELTFPKPDKESAMPVVKGQHHLDPSLSKKSSWKEAQFVAHLDTKRGKKMALHNGHPGSLVDPSLNMDARHEHGSSRFHKNGSQNNRFGKEHEYQGQSRGTGKGNKQHGAPAQGERRRQGYHFEYQPVAQHNNEKTDNFEPPKDVSHNSHSRFKERGQIHSRHGGGNFNGRKTGNTRVDAG